MGRPKGAKLKSKFIDVLFLLRMGIYLVSRKGGIHIMSEKEIKALIEDSMLDSELSELFEKIQYMMDFGKVYIQYDFCLN